MTKPKQKIFFKTFGCRTNIVDSEIMISNLQDYDVLDNDKDADIVIVNSCTVTNNADYKTRAYISFLNKRKTPPKILFTGCGVKSQAKILFNQNKIHSVFEASNKENINDILAKSNKNKLYIKGNFKSKDSTIIKSYSNKTKAFVKIQEGCDFSCSYCIIPSVRGKARSFDETYILNQINSLAQNGHKEFVLTGTNIGSYGKDTNSSLARLCKKIFDIKGMERLRLSSIEPTQIDDEFFEIVNEPKLAKYLHIALQHTNKDVLKIMKRRNKVKKDLALFEKLSQLGFGLGSDFIVGHPGENDTRFKNAIAMLEHFPLTHLHIFMFSKREGTLSAGMNGQINKAIASLRSKQIRQIIEN